MGERRELTKYSLHGARWTETRHIVRFWFLFFREMPIEGDRPPPSKEEKAQEVQSPSSRHWSRFIRKIDRGGGGGVSSFLPVKEIAAQLWGLPNMGLLLRC